MAKKEEIKPKDDEIIENTDENTEENELEDETPPEPPKKIKSNKPINLMETAEPGGKDEQKFNPLDLSPIMNQLKNLDKKVSDALEGKKPKNEESYGKNLIEELGDW